MSKQLVDEIISQLRKEMINYTDEWEEFEEALFNASQSMQLEYDFDNELDSNKKDKIIESIDTFYFAGYEFPTNYTVDVFLEDANELWFEVSIDGKYQRNANFKQQVEFFKKHFKEMMFDGIENFGISKALFDGDDAVVPYRTEIYKLIESDDTDEEQLSEIIDTIKYLTSHLKESVDKCYEFIDVMNDIEKKMKQLDSQW